jgi:hypothetical protein
MLFLLGLSSDITQRKLILYISVFPFITSIITSIFILQDKPIKKIIKNTNLSLITLIVVVSLIFYDVVFLDGLLTKLLDYGIKLIMPIPVNEINEWLDKQINKTNNSSDIIIDVNN